MTTIVLVLVVAANAAGQDTATQSAKQPTHSGGAVPTRQPNVEKAGASGAPCLFDFERGEVPNCIRADAAGDFFIAPKFLKELSFDSDGLAAVLSKEKGWMYVNRKGRSKWCPGDGQLG